MLKRFQRWPRTAVLLGLGAFSGTAPAAPPPVPLPVSVSLPAPVPLGRVPFEDPFNPPSFRPLNRWEQREVDLGSTVFNTEWVPAGTPGAARRSGVGPFYNSFSCDSCHNSAKRGRGPEGAGRVPAGIVIQLGTRGPDGRALPDGDPVYGRTLNTLAPEGELPEARVTARYESMTGLYGDGTVWRVRHFAYEVSELRFGPLNPATLIKPRLAPQLFGLGLLETAMTQAGPAATARFGWQGDVPSILAQTAKAFALEMGLTSSDFPHDDVTAAEVAAGAQTSAASPGVAGELMDALVAFQALMAVPPVQPLAAAAARKGTALFAKAGCPACHLPALPVPGGTIAAYTDLKLHDMGEGLADATLSGRTVPSRWRTAPLWGLGYHGHGRSFENYLHDGRAPSVEEAILWHGGEGQAAKERFEHLSAAQRRVLLTWLESL